VAGFDWGVGVIVVQEVKDQPAYAYDKDVIIATRYAKKDDPVLTMKFDAGYGEGACPRFWAKDKEFIYFPYQYDGATGVERVAVEPTIYLAGELTPYPGGG
jgi:hypothetical protein